MTEVTAARRWLSRRRRNGCWVADGQGLTRPACSEPRLLCPGSGFSELSYMKYTEMKRKVVNARKLRLSPNEEAFILKEDYERRRKLRLLQVREQERDIALQIREDIKQRRNQQLTRLAEELRAEWEESQTQKIQNLEKLYLASLRSMGEGHRQAKENEPDLDALAQQAAQRKRKADLRHKEALKVQKNKKEILMKQKTWHIKARKEALLVEKERSARITSLPPPPPALFENIEVKRISAVKTNSSTYHHLHTFVSREIDTKQPDAHLAAEEEAKRLEELQKQAAQERMERFEKAHVRGFQAMKKIHLAQNQEKLMKELKQLQQEDLARRRQTVAQMPPQLVELPYKRSEMKEDWQRELEFAFEDMYNADRKVKGNLILHLEPEPLPTVTDQIQDEELNLSVEQENLDAAEDLPVTEAEIICSSETDVPLVMKTQQIPSKVLFKKLLNKIRSQKSLWTIKSMSEDESEMITTVSETESKAPTVESGTIASEERTLSSGQEQVVESDTLTIESGPLASEDKPLSCGTNSGKEQEINEALPITTVAQSSVLLHPQEEAARIRMSARQKQIMEIEEQKQKQLELLEQIEQQKLRLETDCFRAQLEEEKRKKTQLTGVGIAPASCAVISDEDSHRQMIRNYQHQLLQQNRLHRQSVETARKRLLEYQTMLKGRCPSMSAPSLITDSVISVPSWKSERPTAISEYWDQGQRLKLSPDKYQPIQPIQTSKLEQDHFQVAKQNHFPQRQVETAETSGASDTLTNQSLESQEHLRQFSQTETQQRDYKLVPENSETLSRALSRDRRLISQDARKVSETCRATTFQSLDSQQLFSENSENISSHLTEPSSFVPLVPQRSFSSLPVKVETGNIQEPFSAMSKSTVSTSHSIINQMYDRPLLPSENITVQQGNMKALQEQLDLQKKVLQARQEAQEQLLLCKQKELEQQTGLSVFLPFVTPDLSALLPSAKADLGRMQESSPTKNNTAVSSDHDVISQLQDRLLSLSQPILSQQNNFKFLQEQLNIQKDSFQARREAQEVSCVHKQSELDGRVCSEQAEPSFPFQVAQHTFTSLPSADTKSGKIQEQYSSKSDKGLVSCQSDIPKSQDESLSFLQQFLPLHDSLKLLQEQLTKQRDTLQARHEAQVELLLHRQRDLGDSKSGPMSSSSSPMVVQHSVASQASAKAEPRRTQELYLSEKENVVPSSHLIIPTFQDKSLSFPQHSLPQQENLTILQEQSQIQRVILGAKEGTQEFVHKESELEKMISSEQTGTSSSLSQVDESERFQECISIKSDSTIPLSHPKIPRCQERLLRVSQHMLPLQDNLEEHQAWLDTEKEAFHFSQKTQENTASEQSGSSSFIPQLVQLSFTSLASAESGTILEPLLTESESKIFSSHLQIPQLQDRLLRISQLIQPQQDNLKALQEQLAAQREAIILARQEAREELLLHQQSEWEGRISPEQVDTSSLPLVPQHSFTSLPLTESERNQEPCSINSDNMVSSGHSAITLPDRPLGLSHLVLPQQDNSIALEEHLHAQTDLLPSIEKTQKELVLSQPCIFEEKVSSEHFIQSHHGDLQVLQQQLDTQKKAIQSIQEVQEELLLQRLSELENRVSSEQVSSSSFLSQVVLPVVDSERTQKSFPTKSNDTVPSSHPEIPRLQDRLLSLSQPVLPQQDNLTAQLDAQREVVYSYEKPQEELPLNKQRKLNKSESAEHTVPSLLLPKETEHSFIPLPFAEAKPKSTCELYSSQNEHAAPPSGPVIPRFQDRLLSFSQPVLAQQDNLGLQKQLDLQREVLHYSQKAQEKLLVQRQTALQQQIQKHEETLKDFFKDSQISKPTVENDLKTQKMGQLREWFPNTQDLAGNDQENIRHADRNNSDDNHLPTDDTSAKQSGEHLEKDLGRRSSKPPVAKVKCGLDLNQHELSAIQEVESPASGRTSLLGKPGISQDRDPLRVSISREQSFFGSPLACDPFSCLQQVGQENVCGDDYNEAVKVKESVVENHAVLSYAVEEEHTYLGPIVKPDDKAKTLSHEPLSSVTVSTGSLLSYENTDLSLTDPESFSEHMDDSKQESTTGKEQETNISSIVPSTQDIDQWRNSSDVHKSLLPAVDETTCAHTYFRQMIDKYINEANVIPEKTDLQVDLDFPELEHIFPNLHHQLFKPLEPHPDFDLSSSSSGISPDNRDFYQRSDSSSESHCAPGSSKSTVYFTALRRTSMHSSLNTSSNQQPDTNLAHVGAHSFATENIIGGSEQCFEQLLPEYSSQEESQHADLPSIFSIEARDSSQGMKNQNYSSEEHTEILQNKKKSVHFQLSVGNLSSVYGSCDEANVFDQLNVHSTPCGSNSSECSIKHQLESRKERMGFEELSKRGVVTILQSQGLTEDNKNETCRVLAINPQIEEIDSRLCVEMGTSVQAPYSLTTQNEKCFENSAEIDIPKITKKLSQLSQSELFASSGSFSLQSSIPVWETETGHGIMEEPELTLVSTSDTSIAEMDFANLTLEEKSENEAKSSFQVGEFLPLVSETEASDYPAVSELSIEKPRTASTDTPQRFTPIPGSLQEAFIKRKKSFMERSHQREKEIRNKIRLSENSQIKTVKEKPSISSSVSRLKGVNKVRASFPEDRKTTQALRHQRGLRLYNQLAEVKQQKEEKAKQEAYAQNRARAKEFHKKTLEKLRARNTC
ncbi:centrosomal protein of 295 kDa isoform X12 [Trachypithecus francoisi]|uniref:centrosomal protein of 295 kDa isoform X12 n=1 Tax=Trachypithecus francoisi TaxID=54180 RepID=UPI00141A7190|nr:centrosomal protein of 295 kDa isoform X12 [Trachypithecus francoisi]